MRWTFPKNHNERGANRHMGRLEKKEKAPVNLLLGRGWLKRTSLLKIQGSGKFE